MYSIKPILHAYKNNQGLHLVTLQVIVNTIKVNQKTVVKVKANQWRNEQVVKHELAEKYNYQINKQRLLIENKIIDALKFRDTFSKKELDALLSNKYYQGDYFYEFTINLIDQLKGKLSEGRLRHYKVMADKVKAYNAKTRMSNINSDWLLKFEQHLRKSNIANATIRSNTNIVKAIVRMYNKNADFKSYKNVRPFIKKAEFLIEDEFADFKKQVYETTNRYMRLSGFYFLLSCYTGLRISDALRFDESMIRNDELELYANKNEKRNSIPMFPELQKVVDYILNNKFSISPEKIRESVKIIAAIAGIKKHVKFHTSRHTFCTRLLMLGFTIPEVAEMAGDTIRTISETYAHVDRSALKKKVLEKLG